jgi:hypothetical protein
MGAGGRIAPTSLRRPGPAWYHNLRANPHATIVVDGVRREVVARELSGSDREHAVVVAGVAWRRPRPMPVGSGTT